MNSRFSGQRGRGRGRGHGGNQWGSGTVFSRLGGGQSQEGQPPANDRGRTVSQFPAGKAPFGGADTAGQNDGRVQVSIKGWRGGTEESLQKFLSTKIGRAVGATDINYRGDVMYILVPSMEIAQDLLKLSGIRFAGDKLSIQVKTRPVPFGSAGHAQDGFNGSRGGGSDSLAVRDRLVALLQTRVDPQGSVLDLSALSRDYIIQSLSANPLHDDKLFKAILVLAAQLYPGIVTINFADNGLSSLRPLADIGAHFPNLRNLSLMNNAITDFRELDCLAAAGSKVPLTQLNELILTGNPASNVELGAPNGEASYIEKVQQRFPTISMLDMNPVTPRAQPGQATPGQPDVNAAPKQLPFPVAQSFVENQDVNDLTNTFLAGFFGLYDGNRHGLADIYDQSAVFSLMVDTTHPTSTFAQTNPHSQKRIDFSTYIRISRNLTRVKGHQKRVSALVVGKSAVVQTLLQLPATQHPVQDAQRFSFDAWQTDVDGAGELQTQAVITVVIHGEFTEQPSQNVISFDRVFVLAPAPPGSPAAAAGSPCTITNDQLTIRRYNGFNSWIPSSSEPTPAPNLTPEQQEMARALQELTGLNAEWTLKCLENYGWDYQQALSQFPQIRGALPPEAFH
ncbi:nuclear mRNA export, poly(A)+RNA binding protein [Coemansia guatemalensis]|uniref:mRNA export factor MEX67 n=1 Tax=Coemansia guatemalensis TaxID=2761395 RepID=A0A9W8I1T0_9FUNG|nr:nuclear mRNA export, poly(A)+RNA binding protein [Coemansia guatemalensis]